MSTTSPNADSLHHHSRRMGGRDPHEVHRVATPLELLFDLTFVISNMSVCLVILTFAPAVTVVGYEVLGYRHQAEALATKKSRAI